MIVEALFDQHSLNYKRVLQMSLVPFPTNHGLIVTACFGMNNNLLLLLFQVILL